MKRFMLLCASAALFFGGCTSPKIKQVVHENALRNQRFVAFIDSGDTTREQEQAFIRANAAAWTALDEHFNE